MPTSAMGFMATKVGYTSLDRLVKKDKDIHNKLNSYNNIKVGNNHNHNIQDIPSITMDHNKELMLDIVRLEEVIFVKVLKVSVVTYKA